MLDVEWKTRRRRLFVWVEWKGGVRLHFRNVWSIVKVVKISFITTVVISTMLDERLMSG
jgi:hypothetical protein